VHHEVAHGGGDLQVRLTPKIGELFTVPASVSPCMAEPESPMFSGGRPM